MEGSPIARRLIFAAAATYPSINAGDTVSTSAMLSNPAAESSGGNSALTSTSSESRSRTTLAYSVRFRRWSAGAPGSGCLTATRSSADSIEVVNVARAATLGFGAPSGGIMPVRSLRTTFSHTSACPSTFTGSRPSSARPPLLTRALWQLTQDLFQKRGRRRDSSRVLFRLLAARERWRRSDEKENRGAQEDLRHHFMRPFVALPRRVQQPLQQRHRRWLRDG